MKPVDLPEEEPKPKANEPPKREPKVVIHRGMTTHYPSEADRSQIDPLPQPESLADSPPESPPQPESPADSQPESPPQPESPADNQPESPPQVESQAAPNLQSASAADIQPESPLQAESQAAPPPQSASAADIQPESPPQTESQPTSPVQSPNQEVPPRADKGINPGLRLRAFEAAAKMAPPAKVPLRYRLRPNRELTRRAYWDVASAVSLIVNVILVSVLFIMAIQLKNLKTTVNGLLGGLYSNLVDMNQASINTTIKVDAQIPLNFTLQVQQNTDAILARSISISDAYIILNSIDVPVNFSLPAGTDLPITLNTDIPVQMTVPISLQIPVNIPLNQTNLQAPLTGLQTTIRRLYCTFDKNAQYPAGIFICAGHDTPTPGTP